MPRKRPNKESTTTATDVSVVDDNKRPKRSTKTATTTTTTRKKKNIKKESMTKSLFKCSECTDSFDTNDDINQHIFKIHYGLARINDDKRTPFTENEIIKALIKAQKVMKVLKCQNTGCSRTFKSGLGLKMHWDLCGKSESELTTDCDICGRRLKKNSLVSHMKTHNKPEDSDDDTDNEIIDSRKRKSAIKASKTIRKSTKGELIISGSLSDTDNEWNGKTDDEETEQEEEDNREEEENQQKIKTKRPKEKLTKETNYSKMTAESMLRKILSTWSDLMLSVKDFLRQVPKDNTWTYDVAKAGKVKCPLKGCNQEFTTRDGLKYHYQRCGIEFKFLWKCKLCGFEAQKGNKTIIQHIWNNHKTSATELDSDLQEFVVVNIENYKEIATTRFAKNEIKRIGTVSYAIEFHERFYRQKSFASYVPQMQSWTPLSLEEHSTYIPNPKVSAQFKTTTDDEESWKLLNLFDSHASQHSVTFYAGGPVWSAAWCPVPLSVTDSDQFLAIASNMNWETTHTLNDTDIESGLIQIWNIGKLVKQFDGSIKPRLAFSIAHCCGMVWDMEWCPGGTTWDEIVSGHHLTNLDSLPRLGLLAVACGDGYVRIHSIPYPQSLDNSYDYTLYYNEPIIILNPPGTGSSVGNEETICKCVSWIKSNDQRLVAAGYGSGVIAIWDLTTVSSLLIVEQNPSQTILRPLTSWLAHSAAVNRIKWCDNSSDRFLISCSFDRSAKLWNIKDTVIPITNVKKGLFTSVATHLQWSGMYLANDDCYLGFQNNVFFKDFGYQNFGANGLNCHKTCVWDLSVSEWTLATASVDAAGEATIFPDFQLKADPKRKPYDRIPLYHITVLPLTQTTTTTTTTGKSQKSGPKSKKSNNKQNEILTDIGIAEDELPLRSYNDFSMKYGLVFNDYDLSNLKDIPIEEINRIRLPTHMQYQRLSDYPILSINRVFWNPNLTSCLWLLTTTQSGLCRLSCASFLNTLFNNNNNSFANNNNNNNLD
ncbi:general transcription factor 3C polypeptide 2-like [Oppia nitens]|uniref:general transcription factor 3C polypeptide 2-like n=1 Tax=Oppia nitens TaxID=1686743 RepID=UPI0023DC7235|nr:general transcription factor 3C polypeptide 2-like [Oppia nitens]